MGNRQSRDWSKAKKVEARQVLLEIIERRCPDLLPLIANRTRILTDEERMTIQSALAEELTANGLESTSEPTPYGLQIDDLIDFVGTL